jgi:hypothetical protein
MTVFEISRSTSAWSSEINRLGEQSAISQSLKTPITQWDSFIAGRDRLYVYQQGSDHHLSGFLRIGERDLYLSDGKCPLKFFSNVVSILDFYVVNQREGIGTLLYEYSIEQLSNPNRLAYDRPSMKFESFLRKRGIEDLLHQHNKFSISVSQFFPSTPSEECVKTGFPHC